MEVLNRSLNLPFGKAPGPIGNMGRANGKAPEAIGKLLGANCQMTEGNIRLMGDFEKCMERVVELEWLFCS